MGGLIRDTKGQGSEGIPLLSKIPVIGGLFGAQDIKEQRSELVLFVTPRVVETQNDMRTIVEDLRKRMERLDELFPFPNRQDPNDEWNKGGFRSTIPPPGASATPEKAAAEIAAAKAARETAVAEIAAAKAAQEKAAAEYAAAKALQQKAAADVAAAKAAQDQLARDKAAQSRAAAPRGASPSGSAAPATSAGAPAPAPSGASTPNPAAANAPAAAPATAPRRERQRRGSGTPPASSGQQAP
jgi:Flp pilus assembly secretin CpaC